jgi:hypothetical protein
VHAWQAKTRETQTALLRTVTRTATPLILIGSLYKQEFLLSGVISRFGTAGRCHTLSARFQKLTPL